MSTDHASTRTAAPDSRVSAVEMVLRQTDYWRMRYRRVWKGSLTISFVEPVLFLVAMGLLLGQYVDDAAGESAGLGGSYLEFVAPGLLAASAMQIAASETTWPVMGAVKWDRTYYGMLASPLRVRDIVTGHLTYVTLRLASTAAVFTVVIAFFGVFTSVGGALVALLGATLTGVAFAFPIYAFAAGATSEASFGLVFRVGIVPLFLFSGAFFPVSNLAEPLEVLARVLPLWHGVELCRGAAQGTLGLLPGLGHAAYLLAMAAVGAVVGVRRLTRRLVV